MVPIDLRVVQILVRTAATLNVDSPSGVRPGPVALVPLVDGARSRPDVGGPYGGLQVPRGSPVHQLGPAQGAPVEPGVFDGGDISVGPRQPALEAVDVEFVAFERIGLSRLRTRLLLRGLVREDAIQIRLSHHLLLTVRDHNGLTHIHKLHANREGFKNWKQLQI